MSTTAKSLTEMTNEELRGYIHTLAPLCDARIEAARECARRRREERTAC